MEMVETVISTPKESTELGLALAKVVLEVKKALKDGAQISDLAAVLALSTSQEVVKGVQGMEKIKDELGEDKVAFAAAFMVAAIKLSEELKKQ